MTTIYAPLSDDERETLRRCENEMRKSLDLINRGWTGFARHAFIVRDRQLFREKCDTFDEYIEQEFKPLSRSTVYEWLQAAGVVIAIESTPVVIDGESRVIDPPSRISHARELSRLPANVQPYALHEAQERARREDREVTTYDVRRVVTARLGEPAPRTNGDIVHERKQRALCDLVRRVWGQIDEERRSALLEELSK